jgi:DNA-binding transcriptional LysR family regulator
MRELMNRETIYFLQVAREKSLSRAARQLGQTPASLSLAITRLEKRLSIRLFDRDTQGISLTPQGGALFETLKRLSEEWEARVHLALEPQQLPHLRIGVTYDDYQRYLMSALHELKNELPSSQIFCRPSVELYRAVEDRRLDFAWVSWPHEPKGTLDYRRVRWQKGGVVGLTKVFGHLKGIRNRSELAQYPLAFIPREPAPEWPSFVAHSTSGFIVRDFSTLRWLVLKGEAMGDVEYDLFTRKEMRKLTIITPDLEEDPATYLVYPKSMPPIQQDLMKLIHRRYARLVEKRARE